MVRVCVCFCEVNQLLKEVDLELQSVRCLRFVSANMILLSPSAGLPNKVGNIIQSGPAFCKGI
jgi:hypothetical protein